MAYRTLVTTQTTQHGTGPTLALTREADGAYRVGLLDEGWRLTWLPESTYTTYGDAHARLAHEARERS